MARVVEAVLLTEAAERAREGADGGKRAATVAVEYLRRHIAPPWRAGLPDEHALSGFEFESLVPEIHGL